MSESYREQFPLLCDDLSDEEHYTPRYQGQYRQMKCKSRARSNLKGAVAILKRWPEHWSSFITYWWIGVIIICLMTFILYNSLLAFAVLPTANFKPLKSQVPALNTVQYTSEEISQFPNVYTHVFTDDMKNIDLHTFLPHIEAMANKYSTFNYHLVVVINDTSTDSPELSPEENNLNALNSLWTKNIITNNGNTIASNIQIEYISLTNYMDNSPLSKHWRSLSVEIIEFLIGAVSIWNKGGITFNPLILIPQSPYSAYYNKLENIIKSFGSNESVNSSHKQFHKLSNVSHYQLKQKVNNIRDVINAIENENNLDFSHDEILAEAESRNAGFITPKKNSVYRRSSKNTRNLIIPSVSKRDVNTKLLSNNEHGEEKTKAIKALSSSNDNSTLTILPTFLDYLFHHSTINNHSQDESNENYIKEVINNVPNEKYLKTDTVIDNKNNANSITKKNKKIEGHWMSPMIIPANKVDLEIKNNSSYQWYFPSNDKSDQRLTIDIKGNLLATKTTCHAFLGTIFTDSIHYGYEDTISDFIIKELSIFCNGVLSSCNGIDIILM